MVIGRGRSYAVKKDNIIDRIFGKELATPQEAVIVTAVWFSVVSVAFAVIMTYQATSTSNTEALENFQASITKTLDKFESTVNTHFEKIERDLNSQREELSAQRAGIAYLQGAAAQGAAAQGAAAPGVAAQQRK
jgi:hypothetical protein